MKCPRCWSEKAYLHRFQGWKGVVWGLLAFRPMKCDHCYHKFAVHWLFTLGRQVTPKTLPIGQDGDGDRDLPATQPAAGSGDSRRTAPGTTPRRRAKAA